MTPPRVIDDRGFDPRDTGAVGELVERQVLQMRSVAGYDMHDHVPAPAEQERGAHLGDPADLLHEAVDHGALVLGQLDHQQRFDADAERALVDLGVNAADCTDVP